jgi:hypothetical protein
MTGPFAALRAEPRWIPLFVLTVVTAFATNGFVFRRVGLAEITRAAMQGDPRTDELIARLEQSVVPKVLMYSTPPILTAVSVFAVAGCLLLLLYLVTTEVAAPPVLAVVFYAFLVYSLVTGILTAIVVTVQAESFDPNNPLVSSVADFVDKDSTNPFLYELYASLDVFSVLCLALIAHGFSVVVPRLRYGMAWTIVGGAWVGYVIVKSAVLAALFH